MFYTRFNRDWGDLSRSIHPDTVGGSSTEFRTYFITRVL